MEPKNYVWGFLLAAMAPLGALALLNWAVDPLQFYRKAAYAPEFSRQQRYQNPGLARNYPYDSVIIGSSLAESLAPSHVEAVLGGQVVNLSFKGASAWEMSRILQVALRTGRVRRVIWCMDLFAFRGAPRRTASEEGEFPDYLYDTNPFNEVHYLLNFDVLKSSWKIVRAALARRPRAVLDLDQLQNSYSAPAAYSREAVLQQWEREKAARARGRRRFGRDSFAPEALQASFELNAESLIRAHPEVRFEVYFPPLSVIAQKVAEQEGVLAASEAFKAHIQERLAEYPQVRVFDFQTWIDVTENLDHYRDILHYSREVDDRILHAIAAGSVKE